MKRFVKLTSLLIACIMLLSALASCASGESQAENVNNDEGSAEETVLNAETGSNAEIPTETESKTEEETEPVLLVDPNNYDSEFYLSIYHGSNVIAFHWVEESLNDVLSEAIFDRQVKVRDYLGVEIVGSDAGTYTEYTKPFMSAVKTKNGSIDTMLSHVYAGIPSLVSSGYLSDIGSLPGVDLEATYWSHEFMEDLSIFDKYYLGHSDFNILYTHVITFNKEMMDKYATTLEKSVYDMVRDYEWTIDEMISLANLVYVDETSNGKSYDDTFGITGRQWNEFPGFLHASNINIIDQNEAGGYSVALLNDLNKEKTYGLVEKLYNLARSEYAWFDYATTALPTVPLTSGKTLLHLSETGALNNYLDYEISFGVLPYPMYDTLQKDVGYRHLQWGGYIMVPAYLNNPQMAGETLEVLSYFSENVKLAYYEKMLGKQVADVVDDSQMLDIVWDSVCCEFAQTYSEVIGGNNLLYLMASVTETSASSSFASAIEPKARSAEGAIKKFFTKLEKVKDDLN